MRTSAVTDATVRLMEEVQGFLNCMCLAMGISSVYGIVACRSERLDGILSLERRAAQELLLPGHADNAPIAAHSKMGEVIVQSLGLEKMAKSPIAGNELSRGWLGAVAYNGVGVGISGLAQEHDLLLALCTLYRALFDSHMRLHHVGERFRTEEDFRKAYKAAKNGLERPAPDHRRVYSWRGAWYNEYQFFDDPALQDGCRHWDFVTSRPDSLLAWIGYECGQKPIWFANPGPHDPAGCVTVTGTSRRLGTSKLAIMARERWWSVEGLEDDSA